MILQLVTATKDNKCVKCGQVMKTGDTVYFDSDMREVYCTTCVAALARTRADKLDECLGLLEFMNNQIGITREIVLRQEERIVEFLSKIDNVMRDVKEGNLGKPTSKKLK